jgi:hypothetical protein
MESVNFTFTFTLQPAYGMVTDFQPKPYFEEWSALSLDFFAHSMYTHFIFNGNIPPFIV